VPAAPQLRVVSGDITVLAVEVIVNAANSSLLGGGGVDGAIHRAAGPELLEACRALGGCETGDAKVTPGFRLPARWVIHTVGPTYATTKDKTHLLQSCYRTSLAVADELGATSIAFPLVSSGIYRWPKDDAIRQALYVLRTADTAVHTATLVLYDEATLTLARRVSDERDDDAR